MTSVSTMTFHIDHHGQGGLVVVSSSRLVLKVDARSRKDDPCSLHLVPACLAPSSQGTSRRWDKSDTLTLPDQQPELLGG
jgi:hypothetical protein